MAGHLGLWRSGYLGRAGLALDLAREAGGCTFSSNKVHEKQASCWETHEDLALCRHNLFGGDAELCQLSGVVWGFKWSVSYSVTRPEVTHQHVSL